MSTREEYAKALDKMRDELAENYGANHRHLKTVRHYSDGADSRREMLLDLIEALERLKLVGPPSVSTTGSE